MLVLDLPHSTNATAGSSQPRHNARFVQLPATQTDNRAMNTSSAIEAKTSDIHRGTHPNSSTKPLVKTPGRTSRQPEQAGLSKPFDMNTVKCYNCGLLGHMSKDCRKLRVAHRNVEPDIPQEDPQALTEGNDTGGELEYYDEPDPDVVDDWSVSSGEEQDFDDGSDYGLENNEPTTEN
ncbi:hypothetical protein C8J56DRAFT_1047962 [Mycena floridula]|nr:hypothetical protein C8J56DRAFT_1047962 [Mycena floridula]